MLNLYTETAFQVTPAATDSLIRLRVPRSNGSYDKSKFSNKPLEDLRTLTKDEKSYASRLLASKSSIYFRESKSYPRTFHWSILGDGRVLQLQCADFARSETDLKEAYLTLRFEFQDQISPNGVALADLENGDELHLFVCTTTNELFNLRIPIPAFRDPKLLRNENLAQWCRPLESSALGIDTVHAIYSPSPLLLFLSFVSGKLQRLRRKTDHDQWEQDNYDDRTWGSSLRGLVSRRGLQAIEHGNIQLDPRTAQAMALSGDGALLFTVCLNHTLRIWHLNTGRLLATKDLLDLARDPNDRTHLNPTDNTTLQIFKIGAQKFPTVLTYTPQDGGHFKFWDIKGSLTDNLNVEDRFPGMRLSSPDPDPSGNTVWSMIGFRLAPGSDQSPASLWVLWRNHNYHQLYNCQFEFGSMASSWRSSWVKCDPRASSKLCPPEFVKGDLEDPASKWLEYFFQPGLFSEAGLETALSIYENATAIKQPPSQKNGSLKQRMSTTVAAGVSLRKYDASDLDCDRFSIDTDSQWRNLHRIAESVNDSRNAPLALAYDAYTDLAWITMADKCCAVRECSKLELLQQNDLKDIADLEESTARAWPHRKVSTEDGESFINLAVLIAAARTFRGSFPPNLAHDLVVAVKEDLLTGSEFTAPTRLLEIYEGIGFSEAISNDVFDRLETDLSGVGGLSALNNELFLGVLELLVVKSKRSKSSLRNTLFGSQLLSTGLLDVLSAQKHLFLDLLALAIFVEGELNQEEVKMTAFNASELYDHIGPILGLCERNIWLASLTRLVPLEILGPDGHPNSARQHTAATMTSQRPVTILEDTLTKAVRPQPAVDKPLAYLITDQLSEMDEWASGKDTVSLEDGAVYLQCDLLTQGELDLATDFLKFQPSTPWSTYIKGRLATEKGEFVMAAHYFKKASYGLACGKAVGNLVTLSAGLLSMIDAECFNNGLPIYLHHITGLFESARAFDEAARFAHLTLEALQGGQNEPVVNFRADVLSRLFNAELKLSRFQEAYEALVQLPDPALQRSSTTSLVNSILGSHSIFGVQDAVRILQSLPWSMFPHLARHVDQHLTSLLRSQASTVMKAPNSFTGDGKPDYPAIMHAIRLAQKDYRGAVTVLYERLRLIRRSNRARHDPQATALRQILLALINAMACVSPEEAYILVEAEDNEPVAGEANGQGDQGVKKRRRIIVTLEDLRKEYQTLLDKCSRIERGDFDFEVDGQETDESDEDDGVADHSRLNLSSHLGDAMEL